jgi:hypothetical protein
VQLELDPIQRSIIMVIFHCDVYSDQSKQNLRRAPFLINGNPEGSNHQWFSNVDIG